MAEFSADGIKAKATVTAKDDGFEFTLDIKNETDAKFDWIDYPGVLLKNMMADVGGNFKALSLLQEGREITDLSDHFHMVTDYPNKGWDGTYPGPVTMQFMAYYDGVDGFYIGSHDTDHNYKYIDAYQRDGGICFEQKMFRNGLFLFNREKISK